MRIVLVAVVTVILSATCVLAETIRPVTGDTFDSQLRGCWSNEWHASFADGREASGREKICFNGEGQLATEVQGGDQEFASIGAGEYWFENERLHLRKVGTSDGWPFEPKQIHCNAVIRLGETLELSNCLDKAGVARDFSFHIDPEPLRADGQLSGCWDMRDTKEEIERRSEDPYYASEVRFCFDEEGPGQLIIRASEFSGYRDDTGNWVNAGGDGWDEVNTYGVAGHQIRIDDDMSIEICRYGVEGNVLTLAQCVIEGSPNRVPIEDTVYDRVVS